MSIVDEASVAQLRTAFSSIVTESNDFACSVMDVAGDTLANSAYGLPSFVATQSITLHEFLKRFPAENMCPGDVYITNDPWIATGQAMDITLAKPLFKNDRLVAFAGSVAHSPDLGGAQRWNVTTDVFEEAIAIPPMKLYSAGNPNETLLQLLRANSRLPGLTIGDLEAQLITLHLISTRLLELLDEYGLPDITDLATEIYQRSEQLMRAAIQAIPDGRYFSEFWSDGFPDPLAGESQEPEPIRIAVKVSVDGSNMLVDFTGSSEQGPGSFNSTWSYTTAYSLYALRFVLVPNLPNNAGFYRPIKVVSPEGSVFNARYPAATLSRHAIGLQAVDAIYGALAPVLPDVVPAQAGSTPPWILLLMGDDANGRPFHRFVVFNGGTGGGPNQDGITCGFPANVGNTPIEVVESLTPVIFECKQVIVNSAGAGRQRGGFGQRVVIRALKPVRYSLINTRVRRPAQGLDGGDPGRAGRAFLDDREVPYCSDGRLERGQRLVLETPGGGGLGLASERDSILIERDLQDELITEGWLTRPGAGPPNATISLE